MAFSAEHKVYLLCFGLTLIVSVMGDIDLLLGATNYQGLRIY